MKYEHFLIPFLIGVLCSLLVPKQPKSMVVTIILCVIWFSLKNR